MIQVQQILRTILLPISTLCLSLVLIGTDRLFAAAEAEVIVELAREAIYEGETVLYRVTLNHVEHPNPPQLDGLDTDFDVQAAGEKSLNSHQIHIINGRRSEIRRFGRAYDYLLTPRRAGTLEIPAPVAEVDGQTIRGTPLTLKVIAPQDQDMVILEIRTDRDLVYPMQAFTVTLNVSVKSLPEPYSERNPIELLRHLRTPLPTLAIPWVNDDKLPNGLEPQKSLQQWLTTYRSGRGSGFSINNLGESPVAFFFDQGPMPFMPEPRQILRKDRSDTEAMYWDFEFSRTFVPRQIGELALGPVTLKGTFITEVTSQKKVNADDIYAVAHPLVVTVKEVPSEGRPESYIGAIGQFSVASALVPTQAKVGDPMTLTLTLQGQGTIELAEALDLTKIPEVVDQFRVYEATEETRGEQRQFTYSIRPLHAGQTTFPPLALSYFDVEQEKYLTVQTEPISLVISEAEQLTSNDISIAAAAPRRHATLEARNGMLANINDASAIVDHSVNVTHWFLLFSCMAGSYVVVVVVSDQLRQFLGNRELQRRRLAPGRARRRFQEASVDLRDGKLRSAADTMGGALIGLVADVAGIEESGLTSSDVKTQLSNMGIEHDIVQQMSQFFETCDRVRYGASERTLHGLDDDAKSLLDNLIRVLKRKKIL